VTSMPRGFTIIEIGISLVVLGILLAVGLPSFVTWIANTQIRTGAEGVLNGIQLARAEAVRRNMNTQIVLTEAASIPATTGWTVRVVGSGEVVQSRSANEGSPNAQLLIEPANGTTLTFNGMGRVIANPDASPAMTRVDIVNPQGGTCVADGGSMRCLSIRVGSGGNVRMCDPGVAPGADSRAC